MVPWPPLIYVAGIAISLILHALYPLPWFGSPMSDILVAVGWLALLAFVALFFTAIRTMSKGKDADQPERAAGASGHRTARSASRAIRSTLQTRCS